MKFRKILSAVTALAMSASAIAGLAVTASADTEKIYYVGSESAAETFDGYTNSEGYWSSTTGTFSSSASGNDLFGIVNIDDYTSYAGAGASYTGNMANSALSTQIRGKNTATTTLTLPENVTNGKLYFSTDIWNYAYNTSSSTVWQAIQGMALTFYDSTNSKVATMTVGSTSGYTDAAYITLEGDGTGNTLSTTGTTNTKAGGYSFGIDIVIDLDEKTVSGAADYYNSSNSYAAVSEDLVYSEETTTAIDATNVSYVTLSFSGNANSTNHAYMLDNTLVYAETDKSINPTYAVTVSTEPYAAVTYSGNTYYSDNDGTIKVADVEEGTEVTVEVSKGGYISDSKTIEMDAEDTVIEVPLSLDTETLGSNVIYYEDFNTVPEETNAAWGFGTGDKLYTSLSMDNKYLLITTSNGGRTITKTFGDGEITATDNYSIDFDLKSWLSNSNKTGQTLAFAFNSDSGSIFTLTQTCNNEDPTGSMVITTASDSDGVEIDVLNNTQVHVKATVLGTTIVVDVTDSNGDVIGSVAELETVGGQLTNIVLTNNQQVNAAFDNFEIATVDAPVIYTAQSDTVDSTTIPSISDDDAVYSAEDDSETTYGTITDSKSITTIYAKIDNAIDDVYPTITIDGEDQTSVWTPVTGTNIYFAQLIGDLADFGIVTINYTGASSANAIEYHVPTTTQWY